MVAGVILLPQKDVMEWVTKRFYSFNSIVRALQIQKTGEKENVRLPVFEPKETFKNIVVIGGGPNAVLHADAIQDFIGKLDNVCLVHASSKNAKNYQNVKCKQFYCLVGNEGHRLEKIFYKFETFNGQCVLPSSPRKMGTYLPKVAQKNSFELKDVSFTDKYKDAHTALALQTSLDLGVENIYITGYDGYANESVTNKERGLISENEYLFEKIQKKTNLIDITATQYSISIQSVYSLI